MIYEYQEAEVGMTCRPGNEESFYDVPADEAVWHTELVASSAEELLASICEKLNNEDYPISYWARCVVRNDECHSSYRVLD